MMAWAMTIRIQSACPVNINLDIINKITRLDWEGDPTSIAGNKFESVMTILSHCLEEVGLLEGTGRESRGVVVR